MSEFTDKYKCYDGGICGIGGYCKDCPFQEIARLQAENERLRTRLAIVYSGRYLYCDDGELQDSRFPMIDFVRDSIDEIERKMFERTMEKFKALNNES